MNKNKVLLASLLSALLYLIAAVYGWVQLFINRATGWSALFSLILANYLIPSIVLSLLGLIIGLKAYRKNKRGLTLCSVILYLGSALIVTQIGIALIPAIACGLIAFVQMSFQAKEAKDATEDMLP